MLSLSSSVSEIPSVGDISVKRLKNIGITTVEDLFLYFPRDYQDFSNMKKIGDTANEEIVCITGKVVSITNVPTKNRKLTLTKVIITDDTGDIEVVWFNQPYLTDTIKKNSPIVIAGKAEYKFRKFQMASPLYEIPKDGKVTINKILPVYREPEGITSKWIRGKMTGLLHLIQKFEEWLPDEIVARYNLLSFHEAIEHIHYPQNTEMLQQARKRLAFDELFLLQLKSLSMRLEWQTCLTEEEKAPVLKETNYEEILKQLPFTLTKDQEKVLKEIIHDITKPIPALRLLEGDVGSGKTIVAGICIYLMIKNGYQSVLMAPTEVLARQHFKNLASLFSQFNIHTELLVGSTTAKQKKEIKQKLATGLIDFVIGTHALIQDDVIFKKLGLAVIDEQHRFGVEQRAKLKEKGSCHLLNMTATPIPRSLALTLYGDQDLSIIREMPPGRKEIITRVIPPKYRHTAYKFMEDHMMKGKQIFVICPLVEESEVLEVKAATQEYEKLSSEIFPKFQVGLLHGRMKAQEKEEIMKKFKDGELDILVSTSVIEVGIDIPNASIICIEGAERFGLAQLHQFRGRVGRGEHQSYCFLFTSELNQQNRTRMKAMVTHSSGFDLAEIDLEIRGPGEVFGTRQSGIPDLKMADLNDRDLLEKAREGVNWILEKDPKLEYYFRVQKKFKNFLGTKELGKK